MSDVDQQEYAREKLAEYLVEHGVAPAVAKATVAKHVTEFDYVSDAKYLLIRQGERSFPAPMREGTSLHWVGFADILLRAAPRSFSASGQLSTEELMERKRATGRYGI